MIQLQKAEKRETLRAVNRPIHFSLEIHQRIGFKNPGHDWGGYEEFNAWMTSGIWTVRGGGQAGSSKD